MRILAIGECMAELSPGNRLGDYHLGFAGDTFNTIWYLARCKPDMSVSYLTVIGNDEISQQLREFIRFSGIDDTFVRVDENRTIGLYMSSLKEGERSFSYWRSQSAARTLADDPISLTRAMSVADLIYFSGITLAILEPEQRTTLLNCLHNSQTQGKTIAFDPNLRPKLWQSTRLMTDTTMQGAAVSDIVLPSFEDENNWFTDATPNATIERYKSAGASTVIVKNGSQPVIYSSNGEEGEVLINPIDNLVDSTAAGDSFNAGVFANLAVGANLVDGIEFANKLSRRVIQHKGALAEITIPPLISTTQQ